MTTLLQVEGIGEVYTQKLNAAGVRSTAALLRQGATPRGRKALAEKSGVSELLILRWVNHVDLFRIKGVAAQYAELLEAAGVDTVVELSKRKPANLHTALIQTNAKFKRVRKLPSADQVARWVKQAKSLPRVIKY